MASIPLLCNICPKHPDFSDISHLLTHVSSKGHLSHYFKAQVRSRQEPQISRQLEVYDRWYDEHRIEKLLSQRMILKESKNATNTSRSTKNKPSAPNKTAKSTKKLARAEVAVSHSRTQTKDENVIDPQLSQSRTTPASALLRRRPSSLCSPGPDLPSQHRAYAPRMRAWPAAGKDALENRKTATQPPQLMPQAVSAIFSESGSDSEQLFLQSPTKSIYPDPSIIPNLPHTRGFRSPRPSLDYSHEDIHGEHEEPPPTVDESESTQSPKLKGICWPGMDIFDSASPESQRQRNQKKDDSILKQMELNSIVVEPLEQIFWPEGTLKKERIITGMVESSPLKEDSPKLRRRRNTRDKRVLGNTSKNKSQVSRASGSSSLPSRNESLHPLNFGDLSERALVLLDTPPPHHLAEGQFHGTPIEDKNVEWDLTAGDSNIGCKRRFIVYDDDATEDELEQPKVTAGSNSTMNDYQFMHRSYDQSASHPSRTLHYPDLGIPFTASKDYHSSNKPDHRLVPSNGRDLSHQSHNLPLALDSRKTVGKENIEPILNSSGRIDDRTSQFGRARSVQRYFSVTSGCIPEFFDTLPSQMVFGGWSGPRPSGSSSNPLNPNRQCHQVQQPYQHDPRMSNTASARGISPLRMTMANFSADYHEHQSSNIDLRIADKTFNNRRKRL